MDTQKTTQKREKEESRAIAKREKEESRAIAKREKEESRAITLRSSSLNMKRIALIVSIQYPKGFTSKNVTDAYIERFGRINPYTLEIAPSSYDVCAAIRGYMYESSPSSLQHWFKYGKQYGDMQVAPWLFINKELAIVNDNNSWKTSSAETCSARRSCKNSWFKIDAGTTRETWQTTKYGPLPTSNMLKSASLTRHCGVRNR